MNTRPCLRPIFLCTALLGISTGILYSTQVFAETAKPKEVQIDLDKAIALACPANIPALKPQPIKSGPTLKGWVVEIPGNRPIATPAYWEGKLYVGGGYGSHEFYCFNADTGALVWQINTKDDGPTAAVVEDGLVAFNTESCTVMVLDANTGKVVWEQWLGDPLMSQPAVSNGRLYIAYPSGGAHQSQQNFHNSLQQASHHASAQVGKPTPTAIAGLPIAPGSAVAKGGGHVMLCADLKTGKHLWTQDITADVQSAPVVQGDKLYFTCFDGTSFCLDTGTGKVDWKKATAGTSAPLVSKGEVILTLKDSRSGESVEGIKRMNQSGAFMDKQLLAQAPAPYLSKSGNGGNASLSKTAQMSLDSSVGFGVAPQAANIGVADDLLGVKTVVGGWAHQGSRSTLSKGQIMNAQGKYLNNIDSRSGAMSWRAQAQGRSVTDQNQVFSPPAVGKDKNLYLASQQGHLLSVRQSDGGVNFMFSTGQPVSFQPALAKGNMYVGTTNGRLICLNTGDADADGWYAWGGNAQHNKTD